MAETIHSVPKMRLRALRLRWWFAAALVLFFAGVWLMIWIPHQQTVDAEKAIRAAGGRVGCRSFLPKHWRLRLPRVDRILARTSFVSFKDSPIGDSDLQCLQHVMQLDELDLAYTRVTDEGLAEVAKLRSLRGLSLNQTRVTDRGLQHLESLDHLRRLELFGTTITDEGASSIARLTALEQLYLTETQITDSGLHALSALKNLEVLVLRGTAVSDAGLSALEQLPMLREVNLKNTRVSASGVARLEAALPGVLIHGP